MKATNKHEFFELLEIELNRIGIEDTSDIFADFEEHFSDSAMQGIPEDITAERLGDIKEIARSYLNLESSRINSIMARDIEHRKVSLTKPGRGVPADLSLIGDDAYNKDALNSDNIREYTPKHFSSEIYPDNSNRTSINGMSGYTSTSPNSQNSQNTGFSANSGASANVGGVSGNSAGNTAEAAANKSVADAFSDAGRAAVDAAKITGHAVASAIKQSGVKEAVVGAGKSAADAMKAAGQQAADAIRGAAAKHNAKKPNTAQSVPHPTDSYRENMNTTGTTHTDSFRQNNNNSHKGTIPKQKTKAKKPGYKIISTKDLEQNVNTSKLLVAILLDVFLWSWLLPVLVCGVFVGGGYVIFGLLFEGFDSFYNLYFFISQFFRCGAFVSAAVMAVCVFVWLVKLLIMLIKFIINLHIKAVYDL